MLRFLLCLSAGSALCFLTGCVSLPEVKNGKQRQLTEEDISQLEGRYAMFSRDGGFYRHPTSVCSSSVAIDSSEADPNASPSKPSLASTSLDSSQYEIQIRISDGSVIEFRPYCKGEPKKALRFTGNLSDDGYFKANLDVSAGTKWYLLPLGMWMLRSDRIRFGLTEEDGLIISMAGTGAVFLGGVFPFFGTNWGYLGIHPRVDQ